MVRTQPEQGRWQGPPWKFWMSCELCFGRTMNWWWGSQKSICVGPLFIRNFQLYIYLSIYLFIHLSIYLAIYLAIYLSIYLVGGFKHVFSHNIWDNPSHWLSYFSTWLKPPTRYRWEDVAARTMRTKPLEFCIVEFVGETFHLSRNIYTLWPNLYSLLLKMAQSK